MPGQPAQRGGREPRTARPVRLRRADLPGEVRSPRRADPGRPAGPHHAGLPGRRRRHRAELGGLPRARRHAGGRAGPRRPRDDRRNRRDHGPAQRRRADRDEHRDDDGHHADELSVRRPPGLPRPRAAHPRRGRAVLPGAGARRRDRRHGQPRYRRLPGSGADPPGHAHVPAAHPDLHGARARRPGRHGPVLAAVLLVRRGPDLAGPSRRGAAADRPGHGAAVRPDRGADDDLGDGSARPLPP